MFAEPDDDRLLGPEETSAFRARRLDSLVRRRGMSIHPPPLYGKYHRPLPRVAGIDRAPRGSRGALPSLVLDSVLRAITAIVGFILRCCSAVFQPRCRRMARPRPERAEKASPAKRRRSVELQQGTVLMQLIWFRISQAHCRWERGAFDTGRRMLKAALSLLSCPSGHSRSG